MSTVNLNKETTKEEEQENQFPFVNEECGDTMWDDVLEEQEKIEAEKEAAKEK